MFPLFQKMWGKYMVKFSTNLTPRASKESQNQKCVCPNSHIFMYTPVFSVTFLPQYDRDLPPTFNQENILNKITEKISHFAISLTAVYSDFLLITTII